MPRAGFSLSREEEVVIYVSLGGQPFKLGSLLGLTRDQAVEYLEQEGLKPRLRYEPADAPAGTVVEQLPGPGSSVQHGQSIDLVISSGPAEQSLETAVEDDGGGEE